jgi:hypothetical protein
VKDERLGTLEYKYRRGTVRVTSDRCGRWRAEKRMGQKLMRKIFGLGVSSDSRRPEINSTEIRQARARHVLREKRTLFLHHTPAIGSGTRLQSEKAQSRGQRMEIYGRRKMEESGQQSSTMGGMLERALGG